MGRRNPSTPSPPASRADPEERGEPAGESESGGKEEARDTRGAPPPQGRNYLEGYGGIIAEAVTRLEEAEQRQRDMEEAAAMIQLEQLSEALQTISDENNQKHKEAGGSIIWPHKDVNEQLARVIGLLEG